MKKIYKVLIIAGLLALIPMGSIGLASLSPAVAALPLVLFVALLVAVPLFAFVAFVRKIEIVELARRLRSNGYNHLSDHVLEHGHDLSHIDMNNVDFKQTSMEGFDLSESSLKKAKFSGSNCNWINLSKSLAHKSRFIRTNLKNAQLKKGNFSESSFYHANLRGSNVIGADFRKANLKGANLSHITQRNTLWKEAVFNSETILPFSRETAFKKGMIYVG